MSPDRRPSSSCNVYNIVLKTCTLDATLARLPLHESWKEYCSLYQIVLEAMADRKKICSYRKADWKDPNNCPPGRIPIVHFWIVNDGDFEVPIHVTERRQKVKALHLAYPHLPVVFIRHPNSSLFTRSVGELMDETSRRIDDFVKKKSGEVGYLFDIAN